MGEVKGRGALRAPISHSSISAGARTEGVGGTHLPKARVARLQRDTWKDFLPVSDGEESPKNLKFEG